MPAYELIFPDYLDDYEHETESKGYLVGVTVNYDGATIDLTIYDPTRLMQEVRDDVESTGYFTEARLLVVPRVTRDQIAQAVEEMAHGGFQQLL